MACRITITYMIGRNVQSFSRICDGLLASKEYDALFKRSQQGSTPEESLRYIICNTGNLLALEKSANIEGVSRVFHHTGISGALLRGGLVKSSRREWFPTWS